MSIFIDSALKSEIEEAMGLGYVSGVTTNPLLMAKQDSPWRAAIADICGICSGPVYYQIDTQDESRFEDVAREINSISNGRMILKLPASPSYFRLASKISSDIECCMTAVYSEAQIMAAAEVGAKHVAVYVNRITKFHAAGNPDCPCNGIAKVESMRNLIDRCSLGIRILAASLKSPLESAAAVAAGAHDVTASIGVLKELTASPLSQSALEEFNAVIGR